MTDHTIKAAKDAGWTDIQIEMASPAERDRLARFYAIARNEALEDAANIVQLNAQLCETGGYGHVLLASNAAAIRALKDQT